MLSYLNRFGALLIRLLSGGESFSESSIRLSSSGGMNGSGNFRSSVWDPCLLVSQIIGMQAVFYTSLSMWIFLMDVLTQSPKSLDQVFRYQSLYVREEAGAKLVVAFLCNALSCAIALWYLVRRAKLCLDFSCTVHLGHLLLCWTYNHALPTYMSWWLMQITCITVTTVIGEYLCLQTEIKAIPVGLSSTRTQL